MPQRLRNNPRNSLLACLYRAFPHVCLLCDQHCSAERRVDLCAICEKTLPWLEDSCVVCAEPLPDSRDSTCHGCRRSPPPYERTVAALVYADEAQRWVNRLKRQSGLVEGRILGYLLAKKLLAAYRDTSLPDLLVPVPLSNLRLARRGHNQAAILGSHLTRTLGIPLARRALQRVGPAGTQKVLTRAARASNLEGRFRARRRFAGETVALVDDVVTTGATAKAAAEVLLQAGAGSVHIWSATRTVLSR